MSLLVHSLAFLSALLLLPIALVFLLVRPRHLAGLKERLGSLPRGAGGPIWVHGASVGESRVAVRLLRCLEELGQPCFASATTLSGRQILRDMVPDIPSAFAPLDHPWSVERALARVRPALLVLIETEIWPVWILCAKRRGIPVWVISGRLSDRSFPRYRTLSGLLSPVLRSLHRVVARSEVDAKRFIALGVPKHRVSVGGDLKLDPGPRRELLAPDLVCALAGLVVFVAGSTHQGEEQAALSAMRACEKAEIDLVMVVAPRHPRRNAEVEVLLRESGRRLHIRTSLGGAVLAAGDVLLLDTVGELAALYGAASVAFVGGTIAPVGGHNLLEPLFESCPVLFGPHIENSTEMAALAKATGAGVGFPDQLSFEAALIELLSDPADLRMRGIKAQSQLAAHRGSVERLANWIASELVNPGEALS